jgi:branched-chain amino acid transport system permease protein
MIAYIITGLVLGGALALTSTGIIISYKSSGIVNFAFASEAFVVARFFYFCRVEHNWPLWLAAVVSLLLLGPILGLVLWAILFRALQRATQLIKVVATIGLSVTLPAIAAIIFGQTEILNPPGLAPQPVHVFHIDGVAITADQMLMMVVALAVAGIGLVVLRFTDVGLTVRAVVSSEALTSISGTNPQAVSAGVWMVSTFVAGLVGVLLAPIVGLSSTSYAIIMASALAAVICARLTGLGRAIAFSLAIGIATALLDWKIPASSSWLTVATAAIPFVFIVLALVYYGWIGGNSERSSGAGAVDEAIRVVESHERRTTPPRDGVLTPGARHGTRVEWIGPVVAVLVVAALPLIVAGQWIGLVGEGITFGIAFLSYTLVTGEGGMIWLCQITFAGMGAVITAQLAGHGWPILAAVLVGGLAALPVGLVLGFLTVHLGQLYVALVTLAFGLVMDQTFFNLSVFSNLGEGVVVPRPEFAQSDVVFDYFALAVFCIIALAIFVLRRSTAGLALTAVREGELGARTIGVRVVSLKVLVSGGAAFIAGVGGGLIACQALVALPTSYATIGGFVWLAVVVTSGIRSSIATLVAGLSFALLPAVFLIYLPQSLANVPAALFGLGAIMVMKNPEGTVVVAGHQIRRVVEGIRHDYRYTDVGATVSSASTTHEVGVQ